MSYTSNNARVTITEDVESMREHMYRLRFDAIKWQMKIDLKHLLDAFAARMGVDR